jgi:hypothetical protein
MSWRQEATPAATLAPTWRRVVGDALRFDPHGVILLDPLRMTIGAVIPLIVGYLAGEAHPVRHAQLRLDSER